MNDGEREQLFQTYRGIVSRDPQFVEDVQESRADGNISEEQLDTLIAMHMTLTKD